MDSSTNNTNSKDGIKFKILLIGAGMMAPPLVEYLCRFKDSMITIGNEYVDVAERIAKNDPEHVKAVYLDIDNAEQLESLIAENDHVISFIPPFLHPIIARACLKVGRNLTTSSYNSPDMLALQDQVRSKNLVFLNECGLDPGIDIMSTMKVVHAAQTAGHKIVSYQSYCGGLPVPEQADDNPFGYKFSWNPGAAIKASRNLATFRKDGEVVKCEAPLKAAEVRDDFSGSMKLETYPNRDSLSFQDSFGMEDCHTFVRGTIRFEGFSNIISAYHDLGLSSDDAVPEGCDTLIKILQSRIDVTTMQKINVEGTAIGNLIVKVVGGMGNQSQDEVTNLYTNLLQRVDFAHLIKDTSESELESQKLNKHDEKSILKTMNSILKSLDFLEFFSEKQVVIDKKSYLQVLSEAMQAKLALEDNDRDLVIMRHEFGIHDPNSNKEWTRTSTMVASGQSKASGGFSIMSQTVGYTCAIATRLVLQNKFPQRGVLSPIYPEIYEPILQELNDIGISLKEEQTPSQTQKVKDPEA